jgi:hypothetical protein
MIRSYLAGVRARLNEPDELEDRLQRYRKNLREAQARQVQEMPALRAERQRLEAEHTATIIADRERRAAQMGVSRPTMRRVS